MQHMFPVNNLTELLTFTDTYISILVLILLSLVLQHYPFGQQTAADYCDAGVNLLTLPAPVGGKNK